MKKVLLVVALLGFNSVVNAGIASPAQVKLAQANQILNQPITSANDKKQAAKEQVRLASDALKQANASRQGVAEAVQKLSAAIQAFGQIQ